ncbi:MAG: hypothetical protein BWY36_00774 [Candidatus Diapherotrites archaeon ADurb.Bin253]|jgi:hypothetical protein|nr:hypothetical protein [Candidatus Pacearchaeota archaeon]OQA67178.1 MAG: hypothetical protein BWY36_00774 [Candidatus Diapherotrites archaeon ADurb.Bin253]HNZ52464.1 hypothetical protein [Candidatus Pacearchaeota archaeon]HOC96954.1 hypothetical protein [Candidatus Pacearchaeota archaeon]HOH04498.1 hypothetical protein [Candidatus Pacearchaeota archaeon]
MNFQFYFEKLVGSKDFKKFISENKDAFFCSAFFAVDKKGKDNKQNIDYYVPSINKMFSFKINDGVELIPVEDYGEVFKPEKIPDNLDFDFNHIEKLIEGEMFEKKIKNKIEKLLLSIQAKEKKVYILGTIFISGLSLIKIKIDLDEKKIVDFEKMSFFDMIKVVKK